MEVLMQILRVKGMTGWPSIGKEMHLRTPNDHSFRHHALFEGRIQAGAASLHFIFILMEGTPTGERVPSRV